MRVTRVRHGGADRFARVVDDVLLLLAGAPFPRFAGDETLGGAAETGEEIPLSDAALLTPVSPASIFAVGRNYAAHAQEMNLAPEADPTVFMKPTTALLAHGGSVILPPRDLSDEVEHEAELAIVIGRTARNVAAAEALHYVLGYTCADDVSARDLQRRDSSLIRAKGFDTFCPLGPWIETDVNPAALAITCRVNDELRQNGTTTDLIFPVPAIVSSISTWATLRPGDVILTGSPAGSGALNPGDHVDITIAGIGMLSHDVVAAPSTS